MPNSKYRSLYLNILNQADMSIDKFDCDVGFDRRLEDIKLRYDKILFNMLMLKV